MSTTYSHVLDRLIKYRELMKWTQADMAEALGLTQSHYSKIENGCQLLSWNSLQRFHKHGEDVNFLITGVRQCRGELNERMEQLDSDMAKQEFYKLAAWIVHKGLVMEGSRTEVMLKYRRIVRLMAFQSQEQSIWKRIRKNEGLNQMDMANRLDIDIKRYRRIEKLEVGADAEILHEVYETWGYSPLMVLEEDLFYLDELNRLWEGLSEEVKKTLRGFMEYGMRILEELEKADKRQ